MKTWRVITKAGSEAWVTSGSCEIKDGILTFFLANGDFYRSYEGWSEFSEVIWTNTIRNKTVEQRLDYLERTLGIIGGKIFDDNNKRRRSDDPI